MAGPATVRLALSSKQDEAAVILTGPYFRITGGVIWDRLEHGLIATHVAGAWKRRTRLFTDLLFEGECQLMFGITRDLCALSGPLSCVSITGSVLSADGTPFSEYRETRGMWSGIGLNNWWTSLRIISTDLISRATADKLFAVHPISPRTSNPLQAPRPAPAAESAEP
jgi:hypothetical protein